MKDDDPLDAVSIPSIIFNAALALSETQLLGANPPLANTNIYIYIRLGMIIQYILWGQQFFSYL